MQENGVLQGYILSSTTLIVVKMNSKPKKIAKSIIHSIYVDDIQRACTSPSMSLYEKQIQITINKLAAWVNLDGIKFSSQKTVALLFLFKRGLQANSTVHLSDTELPLEQEHKFLGITFDVPTFT